MGTDWFGFFNLTGMEAGMILLGVSLLVSILIMVVYFRRLFAFLRGAGQLPKNCNQINEWVVESDIAFEKLSKTLEERKEIAKELIAQLDAKIEKLRSMTMALDREMVPVAEEVSGQGLEWEVMKMAEEGRGCSEIARQTGLSIGEIQLIIHLKRCQETSAFKVV